MKTMLLSTFLLFAVASFAQKASVLSLFDKEWESPYATQFSQGQPLESAFPNGFTFKRQKNQIYRKSHVNYPGSDKLFSSAVDTFDVKKKVISFSKTGRRIESSISVSKDNKEIRIIRNYFYADDPKRLEFTYNELFKLLEHGDAVLEKTGKATDPDSQFNFVGSKTYPKDGITKESKGQ